MTHIEIVEEAVSKLNEIKKADLQITNIKDDDKLGVKVTIKYPRINGELYFHFISKWFNASEILDLSRSPWMDEFTVPDKLKPEVFIMLRIAYYIWKYGTTKGLL